MFSQTIEYALRAMIHLAQQAPTPRTTSQIAAATKVPAAYLAKVMHSLGQAGLVKAQRGIGGGASLRKDPAQINILEIVDAVDPIRRINTCPLDLPSHGVNLCPLHKRMDDALEQVQEAFRRSTLAEILAEPTSSVPLCDSPPTVALGIRSAAKKSK
jgi:Rrf2 family protein